VSIQLKPVLEVLKKNGTQGAHGKRGEGPGCKKHERYVDFGDALGENLQQRGTGTGLKNTPGTDMVDYVHEKGQAQRIERVAEPCQF